MLDFTTRTITKRKPFFVDLSRVIRVEQNDQKEIKEMKKDLGLVSAMVSPNEKNCL